MYNTLIVSISKNNFYSLYAAGVHSFKEYLKEKNETRLYYPPHSALALFYTYRAHRRAHLVRNTESENPRSLPSLSIKVKELFSVEASRVDKLRRALLFLNSNFKCAFNFNDAFYTRLYHILLQKGALDYYALKYLARTNAITV